MLTIQTWLSGIGLKHPIEECPAWPPDLFALAGTLIRRSGAYLRVFERHDSPYLDDIVPKAAVWRKQIDEIVAEPVTVSELQLVRVDDVVNGWRMLIEARETPISEINKSRELAETLIRLTLLADEVSVGIGIDWDLSKQGNSNPSRFLSVAETALTGNELQSFCLEVPRDVLCVLGKQHTPQKGATFRSLSHHLALYQPNEIEARWFNPIPKTIEQGGGRETLNLLLLPWSTRVETDAFREVRLPGARGWIARLAAIY